MHRITTPLAIFVCLLLFSCKTYTPDELPDQQLRFGKGGGFTGMTTEYMLLKNGQLFVREGRAASGEWKEMEEVDKASAKALYRTWETNELFRQEVREPGNMYYFITMKKDSLDFRQSWGAAGYQPDTTFKSFYKRAMDLIEDSSPKSVQR
jgi:hypothetical protein